MWASMWATACLWITGRARRQYALSGCHHKAMGNIGRWYKVPGVSYPTTGWVTFNGNKYYYENGQYVVSCTKTIDGTSYTFNANGTVQGGGPSGGDTANQVAAPAGGSGQAAAKSWPPPVRRARPQRLYRSRPIQSCPWALRDRRSSPCSSV